MRELMAAYPCRHSFWKFRKNAKTNFDNSTKIAVEDCVRVCYYTYNFIYQIKDFKYTLYCFKICERF